MEKTIVQKAFQNKQVVFGILHVIENPDTFLYKKDFRNFFSYLNENELEYIMSKKFNQDTFIKNYCLIQNNKDINHIDELVPLGIQVAVEGAKIQNHTPMSMCINWNAQNYFEFYYDQLVYRYLNANESKNLVERINNTFFYAYINK